MSRLSGGVTIDQWRARALQCSDSDLMLLAASFIEGEWERVVGDLPEDLTMSKVSPLTAAMIWVLQTRAQQIEVEGTAA